MRRIAWKACREQKFAVRKSIKLDYTADVRRTHDHEFLGAVRREGSNGNRMTPATAAIKPWSLAQHLTILPINNRSTATRAIAHGDDEFSLAVAIQIAPDWHNAFDYIR